MTDFTKKKLRESISNQRRLLKKSQVENASQATTNQLKKVIQDYQPKLKALMSYSAVYNEIDISTLIQDYLNAGVHIVYPKVVNRTLMEAIKIKTLDELTPGTYGILEPTSQDYYLENIDIVIIPGVAFNANFHRIGFGMGYYDRFLTRFDHLNTLKIGLGYDFQIQEFETSPYDIPVDIIITPTQILINPDSHLTH